MKQHELLLRCMAWHDTDGQWVALCLDFDLAAQDDSFEAVKERLDAQVRTYLRDALVGQDREHAGALLRRRAPLRYWIEYYAVMVAHKLRMHFNAQNYSRPIPLAPA